MKLQYDVPQNEGVRNVIDRAHLMATIPWYAMAPLELCKDPWGNHYFRVGHGETIRETNQLSYAGIPYCSCRKNARYVGFGVSFYTFLSAVTEKTSCFYTNSLDDPNSPNFVLGAKNAHLYYGTVCTGLTSYAFGMPYHITTFEVCDSPYFSEVDTPALGIMLCSHTPEGRTGGHVLLITGIARDENGEIAHAEITESTTPLPASRWYTAEEFKKLLHTGGGAYHLYQFRDIDSVKPVEIPSRIFSRRLKIDRGEECAVFVGESISLRVIGDAETIQITGPLNASYEVSKLPLRYIERLPRRELTVSFALPGDYSATLFGSDGQPIDTVRWFVAEEPTCTPLLPQVTFRIEQREGAWYAVSKDGSKVAPIGTETVDGMVIPKYPFAPYLSNSETVEITAYTCRRGDVINAKCEGGFALTIQNEEYASLCHGDVCNGNATVTAPKAGPFVLSAIKQTPFATLCGSGVLIIVTEDEKDA